MASGGYGRFAFFLYDVRNRTTRIPKSLQDIQNETELKILSAINYDLQ